MAISRRPHRGNHVRGHRREARINESSQISKRTHGDERLSRVSETRTDVWVDHPRRHYAPEAIGKVDDQAIQTTTPATAVNPQCLTEERMVPVRNANPFRFWLVMSSLSVTCTTGIGHTKGWVNGLPTTFTAGSDRAKRAT